MSYLLQGYNAKQAPIMVKVTNYGTFITTKPNMQAWSIAWRDVSEPQTAIQKLESMGGSSFQEVDQTQPHEFVADGKKYHLIDTKTGEPVRKAQMLDHYYALNMAFNAQLKATSSRLFWKLEEVKP